MWTAKTDQTGQMHTHVVGFVMSRLKFLLKLIKTQDLRQIEVMFKMSWLCYATRIAFCRH